MKNTISVAQEKRNNIFNDSNFHFLSDWFTWAIFILIILSRWATITGFVYWADGPAHLAAIHSKNYLIQYPGYWLFNRFAGCFPNPQTAIEWMNQIFSALGCVIFYRISLIFFKRHIARLASLGYGFVYFTWFAGAVHSTYASELFFPPLFFLFLIQHYKTKTALWLYYGAVVFALLAGFRPSDGLFMSGLYLFYLYRFAPRLQAGLALMITTTLSLIWITPTAIGLSNSGTIHYANHFFNSSLLFHGLNNLTLANITRYFLPICVAFFILFFPVLKTIKMGGDYKIQLLWWWLLPGSIFFIFICVYSATYMTYQIGAWLLLATFGLNQFSSYLRYIFFYSFLAWNICLFLFLTPLKSNHIVAKVINSYVVQYTNYGLQNHWWPNLSDLADPMKQL